MKTQIITLLFTCFFSVTTLPAAEIPAKIFYAALVDDDNTKWFLTDAGIVSFDGKKWNLHNTNQKIPAKDLKGFTLDVSPSGKELLIATPNGVLVASLPIDGTSAVSIQSAATSSLLSDNVVSITLGKGPLRWYGTDKGISAFYKNKWLTNSYERKYPGNMFTDFPITAMTTDVTGDTLFVGTDGAGIARLFRNQVDGISGASEYAQWGPIEMPSDKVYSICIASDGTQWIGTDSGVGRHIGYNTLENWTIFNTESGLVDNYVQSIAVDKKGNVWFGTKGGVSLFDGTTWTSFTEKEGLISNNVLSIAVDKTGDVWFGTDKGVSTYANGIFSSFNQ